MYKKAKSAFIPAAIACLGVEHAPGALPCTDDILNTRPCDSSKSNLNKKPSKDIVYKKDSSLYERVAIDDNIDDDDSIDDIEGDEDIEIKDDLLDEKEVSSRQIHKRTKHKTRLSSHKKSNNKLLKKAKDISIPKLKHNKNSLKNKKVTRNNANSYTYVINKGDTLEKLALKYNTTVSRLLKINNLKNSNAIKFGQKILIPKNNLQIAKRKVYKNFYVVERGDTLTKIAKITGVNVTRLIKYNNLIIGTIRVGQKIYLTANNYKEKTINNTKIVNKTIPVAKPILKPVQKKVLAKKTIKTTMPKTVALVKHTKKTVAKTIATTKHTKILTTLIKPEKIKSENIKKLASKAKNTIKPVRQIKVTATAYTSHSGQTDETPFLAAWNNRIRPGMKIIAVSRDLIKKYGLTNGVKVRLKGFPGYYIVRDKMNKRFKSRIDIYMGMNKHKALQWGKKRVVLMW